MKATWEIIQNNDSKDNKKTLNKIKKIQESINNNLELKNKYAETNHTITEIKNTPVVV